MNFDLALNIALGIFLFCIAPYVIVVGIWVLCLPFIALGKIFEDGRSQVAVKGGRK